MRPSSWAKERSEACWMCVRKGDGTDEVAVEKAYRQRLDNTIKPNKMEVGTPREDDFPAEDFLMVKGTGVVFTAC
jgi:hypothetical protein